MCGIPIYSGRMPLSEITENLVQWLRQEKISRNNPTRKYRCRKDTWNVFLFFIPTIPLPKLCNFYFWERGTNRRLWNMTCFTLTNLLHNFTCLAFPNSVHTFSERVQFKLHNFSASRYIIYLQTFRSINDFKAPYYLFWCFMKAKDKH